MGNTVQALMGTRAYGGDLGIEIETEAAEAYRIPNIEGWKHVRDGSLRDFGMEYVTNSPVSRADIPSILSRWKGGLGGIHAKLRKDSISTSVHVHLNVQDHTPLQALNLYLTGILFENVMAKYAGPDREGNLFCLRTIDAEDQYNSIKRNLKDVSNDNGLLQAFSANGNGYKYSNINVLPITGQGSVEFRVMRGTTDTDEIRLWSEALVDLKTFSKQFDNPVSIVRKMRELGPDGLLRTALGSNADQFKYPNWERDLLRNFIYVADMATCRKNWEIEASPTAAEVQETQRRHNEERMQRIRQQAVVQGAVAWDEDFEEEDI